MRIFHLSDLHVGARLYNRDLREDQEHIFARIAGADTDIYDVGMVDDVPDMQTHKMIHGTANLSRIQGEQCKTTSEVSFLICYPLV